MLFKTNPFAVASCASERVNQILVLYILALVASALLSIVVRSPYVYVVLLGMATAYLVPSFQALITVKRAVENFQLEQTAPVLDTIGSGDTIPAAFTAPTASNPFMNVLIDEIKYNPQRPPAMSVRGADIAIGLDEFFRTEFTRDPTDVFGRSQSQRQFVSMPNTTIPNDQGSYQNWLYGIPGKTCKEGGREACLPGTDGGALPWLNADR